MREESTLEKYVKISWKPTSTSWIKNGVKEVHQFQRMKEKRVQVRYVKKNMCDLRLKVNFEFVRNAIMEKVLRRSS